MNLTQEKFKNTKKKLKNNIKLSQKNIMVITNYFRFI